jgi:hypothetical protein
MLRVLLSGLAALVGVSMTWCDPPASLADMSVYPTGIHIPAIGVDGNQLIPLGLAKDRTLQTPPLSTPQIGGWYTGASVPGDPGTAIIISHVDGDGKKGLFYDLSRVQVGDEISVDRSDGHMAVFTVTKVGLFCKERAACPRGKKVFPSAEFYSTQSEPQLHLETCGGRFDAKDKNYLDAFVVFSTLTASFG